MSTVDVRALNWLRRLVSTETEPGKSRAVWRSGRTLLTADHFFLVEIDAAGRHRVLANEGDLPGRDTRSTVH